MENCPTLNRYVLVNIDVFTGRKILKNHAVIIEEHHIVDILPTDLIPKDIEVIDGQGYLASAGFIDLQLNGCGGVLFNTNTSALTLQKMNQTNLQSGTTQFLPTLITSELSSLEQAISVVGQHKDREAQGILGLHLEGPFISHAKKGAHNEKFVRELDEHILAFLIKHRNEIKVVTLAPECNSKAHVQALSDAGIHVSLGHTNATYEQLCECKGLHMATHLYNAMSPLSSREPGAVGYIFDHKLYAGIIVDGIHSDYANVRIAHQILGDKLFMVTDAVTPAGTNMQQYDMAGTPAFVTNGRCHYKDGTLAGAAITMIEGVQNLVNKVRLPLEEALRMASLYPAQAVGLGDQYGRIEAGYYANIILLDQDLRIQKTIQMGTVKYQNI
ncbi:MULTISPECIES: N-acetylglucosamine-6-phosphate deacetylase [Vibrio]|uniref:N-acetylglucosamine-6-phosphate deacetylase n=1 Tax=Vibrio TaxID=662 RepID=UPI0007961F79|nr:MULTISPECIES: N-acetylglucosamine-6-phosphate deacetylase [Vibrio]KXZ36929.1 N-acetylglucosamine-6-phosphate deacetylase [Vibrio alginolyticus]MDW2251963.1 N-acetylglucosamine-6-phosphate deacetylase [Vibrio sp. 1569]WMN51365.1 N-acetylglucosamine-6-phosphate deacetylase [Vibrio alginolyticus]